MPGESMQCTYMRIAKIIAVLKATLVKNNIAINIAVMHFTNTSSLSY